jgi:two-component system NtrC family sensor kinase
MRVEIARIEQLVKNMLTYAKADKPDYKPIHLQPMLERILTRWKNRFTRLNIQLIVELDPHTPPALADQFQLERVFNNFIGNACDTIAGKTTADDSQPVIAVRCGPATHPKTPPGQYVEVVFTDTGAGIPAEIKGHIFDSFVTTKADGTGLGLAISKNILTAHRGAIHVDTHPNIGTSFHIFIPIANSRS